MRKIPLILSVCLGIFLSKKTFACSFEVWSEDYRYHLLFPETINNNPMLLPFHFSSAWMFKHPKDYDELGMWKNINDWRRHYNQAIDSNIWFEMLYEFTYPELLSENHEGPNQFLKSLSANARSTFLFIKKIENHYSDYTPWHSRNYTFIEDHERYLDEAKELYNEVKDPFLKCRIAYQMVRMTMDERFMNVWNSYLLPVKHESILGNWSQRYLAGHYQRNGNDGEANKILAILFEQCDEWKYHAYSNFKRGRLAESLKKCSLPNEKAAVRMLDLLKQYKPALNELQVFAKQFPNHPNLDMLVLREINKMEDLVFTELYTANTPAIDGWWYNERNAIPMMERRLYQKQLSRFVYKEATKRPKQAFWNLSAAYLAHLSKETSLASDFFKLADKCEMKPGEQLQYDMLQATWLSHLQTKEDAKFLNDLAIRFNRIQAVLENREGGRGIQSNFALSLAAVLEKNHHYLPAAICNSYTEHYRINRFGYFYSSNWNECNPWEEPYFENNWAGAMNMFFYLEKEVPTNDLTWIEYWVNHEQSPELQKFGQHIISEKYRISDLLGTRLFLESKYRSSLQVFDRIPDIWWDTTRWEVYSYIDGHAFDDPLGYIQSPFRYNTSKRANKCIIADSLYNWELASKGQGEKAALASFKLANLLLNTGYNGQAWAMSRYWKYGSSSAGEYGYTYERRIEPLLDEDYFDGKRALEAYLQVTQKSKDPDIIAAALAHAAVIECPQPDFLKIGKQRKVSGYSQLAGPSLNRLLDLYPDKIEELYSDCPGIDSYLSIH